GGGDEEDGQSVSGDRCAGCRGSAHRRAGRSAQGRLRRGGAWPNRHAFGSGAPAWRAESRSMFNIGWSELLVIGIVALLVIGPKELPGALRTLGQWVTKVRRMASEFQNQFHEAMREAELAELKKEVDEMSAKAQSYARFDPVDDI